MSEEREPFKEKFQLILKITLGLLVQFPILFLSAWTIKWFEGWMWILVFLIYAVILTYYLLKYDVELLKKRTTFKLPEHKWERYILLGFISTIGPVWIIPGLDYQLNWSPNQSTGFMSWTNIPWWIELIGLVGVVISLIIMYNIMRHNTFLTPTAEIQENEEHKVITTGPYRVVRHPMYSAFILFMMSVPLLLGSYYALIPGVISAALFVVRTVFEDRMLQKELDGYSVYTKKTRYKLIPGIW